jgi:cytochrome c oxidase subunit 4
MAAEHSHAPAASSHGHGHADDGAVHVHIASTRFYVGIFLALIALTIATVRVSYYDFGSANIIIAILIATMKASLVAAFFMHLRHDKLFNTISFLSAFLFLAIFILLTYDDLGNRGRIDYAYGARVDSHTGQAAPGGEPSTSATANSVEHEGPPGAAGHGAGAHGAAGGHEKKE